MVAGLGVLTLRLSVQSGELQRADARIRLLAAATEQTADLILITRADGAFEHANDACVHALGYTRDELAGMALPDLLERGFERMVDHVGSEVRQKGHLARHADPPPQGRQHVPGLEHGRRRCGTAEGRVTHFVGVERDITDELKLRDQLVHSERLSAIGELVAGVAHEINNPLQTIIGCVELMIEEQRDSGPAAAISSSCGRKRRAPARSCATCSRSSGAALRTDRRPTSTRSPARRRRCASTTSRSTTSRCSSQLHPGVLPVLVNREEIQQIVLNLVSNAEHAHRPTRRAPSRIRTNAGEHAHILQVADDGPGISPELRGRVFEPFFTTKDVGRGDRPRPLDRARHRHRARRPLELCASASDQGLPAEARSAKGGRVLPTDTAGPRRRRPRAAGDRSLGLMRVSIPRVEAYESRRGSN